jgi:hypothetical protein
MRRATQVTLPSLRTINGCPIVRRTLRDGRIALPAVIPLRRSASCAGSEHAVMVNMRALAPSTQIATQPSLIGVQRAGKSCWGRDQQGSAAG